jgi:Zn-dependent peptidase ImmA (M78 family)
MFRRGFKSWCEETAASVRRDNNLGDTDPLRAEMVAEWLGVPLMAERELVDLPAETAKRLVTTHKSVWSAITVSAGDGHLVIFNSSHSDARQSSDVMHELAHIILSHVPKMSFMDPSKGILIRSFDKDQEEEANWLAGTLLLPRVALLQHRVRQTSDQELRDIYGVSAKMLTFRINTTGVERQLSRRRSPRGHAGASQ